KRRMSPRHVRRRRIRTPPSAESRKPSIGDAAHRERRVEGVCGETGKPSRSGKAANIGDQLDVVGREDIEELVDRTRRVAERPDGRAKVEFNARGGRRRPTWPARQHTTRRDE